MDFDFKRECKEFYMPKNKPEIVNVPKVNYIAASVWNFPVKDMQKQIRPLIEE